MIDDTIDRMYQTTEENKFLEVTYAKGEREIFYFKDFSSGAMIENIVARAKKKAVKRLIERQERGIRLEDLHRGRQRRVQGERGSARTPRTPTTGPASPAARASASSTSARS